MDNLSKATQAVWRRFLASEEGRAGVEYLRSKLPRIAKGEPHEMAFDAGRVEGFRELIGIILDDLITPPAKEVDYEQPGLE